MGFSCTAAASKVVETWIAHCRASMDNQNTFTERGVVRFFEESHEERPDGGIVGRVMTVTDRNGRPVPDNEWKKTKGEGFFAKPTSFFEIAGTGEVLKAPPVLRKLVKP